MYDHPGYIVVLRGEFEPSKFNPSQLFKHGIENKSFSDSTRLDCFSSESAQYRINTTDYYIDRNMFQIFSENISLPDLINNQLTKLFYELYPDILVNILSVIKYVHVKLQNDDEWVKFYNNLIPLRKMSKFARDVENSKEKFQNGLYRLQLSATEELDNCKLIKYVTIERSNFFKDCVGIYVSEEFQYFVETQQKVRVLVDIFKNEIDKRLSEAEETFQTVKELG